MISSKTDVESLVRLFIPDRVLNYDRSGLRVVEYGFINSQPAILMIERAPFSTDLATLTKTIEELSAIKNLGANDIYYWYVANSSFSPNLYDESNASSECTSDLKINLIYPCSEQHIQKYSKQIVRTVIETPQIYRENVAPFILRKREVGSLNWVWNIIEGKTESKDIIYRTPQGHDGDEGFLLLPDLNWDRSTRENMHLLGLAERRDIWSMRDLKKKHIGWLRKMKEKFLEAIMKQYDWLESDQIKMYVHYQPTYYHFHVHIVHVAFEAGATQAIGKAIGLESIIEILEHMSGNQEQGMEKITLEYTIGEASELWTQVFGPLKRARSSDHEVLPPH